MLNPYKIVEETDTSTPYESRTVCLYLLYALLAAMLVGVSSRIAWLEIAGVAGMGLHWVLMSVPGFFVSRRIRQAMRQSNVQVSGSKWSLRTSLRIALPRSLS